MSDSQGPSFGLWLALLDQVAGHQDVVDIPAVEQKLRLQGALGDEAARRIELPRGRVGAQDPQGELAGASSARLLRDRLDKAASAIGWVSFA